MDIKSATFVISNSDPAKGPKDGRSEYAFIGRSNVGKSSLINMLAQQNNLAKTSQTPGKTKLINHFLINDSFYIVDLPGYGYAKMPKGAQQELKRIIEGYIFNRLEMVNLFVLVDMRHAPMAIDLDFMRTMGEHGIPFSIVFTKADKLGFEARKLKLQAYKDKLLETWEELPPIFVTSSSKGEGREELLSFIDQVERDLKGEC